MAEASPGLDQAIMSRILQASEARKKVHQPFMNIKLIVGFVLGYTILSVFALLISFMLDQGFTFDTQSIPQLFAINLGRSTTLVLSLLAFWTLMFANFLLKNYFNKNSPNP